MPTTHNHTRRTAATPHGEISWLEQGTGRVALFVHGVFLNGHLWDATIDHLADERRCVAVDLMGHGATRVAADQDLSFTAQADMLAGLLDTLGVDQVDLVANDSGGAIAQIFAARNPERVRSLTLTNCDTHDNIFPPAVVPLFDAVRAGKLLDIARPMLTDDRRARAFFVPTLEHPDELPVDTMRRFIEPLVRNEEAGRCLQRWMEAMSVEHLLAIEPGLSSINAPTIVVWGTDDVFFDVQWAHWLQAQIPGTIDVVEVPGAKLFFPLERPSFLADQIRRVWSAAPSDRSI